MRRIVPDVPRPPEFPDVKLEHEDIVPISRLGDKTISYMKCKVDKEKFSDATVAECDYVGIIDVNGKKEEVVFGKGYFWEGGEKYVVVLPKWVYYYSEFSGGRPYDAPTYSDAKFFIVERR